ncbi:hypothetical protein BS17DRAFT_879664 [Gyrodon lividus]|nr:hypothetical protein BS17DRAFT_879664 [Gyrodon lividus]
MVPPPQRGTIPLVERLKLYTNHKFHHALLNVYPDIPACHDVMSILACNDFTLLRERNSYLRGKYNLLTKCIEARVYFSERFFGNDMDFGHKTFWDNLVRKRLEVEKLMFHIETRGYQLQLILKDQNALLVLERDEDIHESGDCSDYDDRTLGTNASFHSVESADGTAIEDPLETVLREKAIEFREKVIYAYVRRAIYKDPSLMFVSQSYESVMALLSDNDLDCNTMEKIWNVIKALCISWEKTTDDGRLKDSILEEAQPSGWAHEKIAECLQVVIVDGGEGNMGDFVRKLVNMWCRVYQVENRDGLYAALEGPYEAAGELEKYTCEHHQVSYNIPIIQKDVLSSYQSLWGNPLRIRSTIIHLSLWNFDTILMDKGYNV